MSDIAEFGPAASVVAVCVMIPDGGNLTRQKLFYARGVQPEEEFQTNRYEGDDTSQEEDELLAARLTILCDKLDFDSIQTIYGKTKVTAGLDAEAEWAMYMLDDNEIGGVRPVGVEVYQRFKDESVTPNTKQYIRRYYPYGTIKAMRTQNAEWKAKFPMQLNFTAEKTIIDAAGDPLPGSPSGGSYYRWELLSALPAF